VKERFLGLVPEIRKDVRCGNIKKSINVPFNLMLNEDGTLKSNDELLNIFKDVGVEISK
jgi:thiosulfate/3-mercaptopyruvate sulfurtransferase